MKHRIKKALAWTSRILVLAACGAASAYLLMAGYESVYNKSLPIVHVLAPINMSAFNGVYDLQTAAKAVKGNKVYGNFGKPQTVKLPDRALRLDVVSPLQQRKGEWLARSNTLHLLLPAPPRSGNIGIALLYCRSSFRTLDEQNLPTVGSNIFMDTDHDWRYVYKVTNAKAYPESEIYVPADTGETGKLIIDCNNSGQHRNVIVEASLLSVQGTDQ